MKETLKSNLKSAITTNSKSNLDNIKAGNLWKFDIARDGNMALLTVKNDDSVKFKMTRASEGHWKIVEIVLQSEKEKSGL
jgi:hypothetical protein